MKKLAAPLLFLLIFVADNVSASFGPECDSILKTMERVNKEANAYAYKYKQNIDTCFNGTQKLIPRDGLDENQALNLIARYKKDTAFYHQILDVANNYIRAIKDRQEILRKNCGEQMKTALIPVYNENDRTIDNLKLLIEKAEDILDESEKGIKRASGIYNKMVKQR